MQDPIGDGGTMRHLARIVCLAVVASNGMAQEAKIPVSITNPAPQFELVGKLGLKMGEMATVEGLVVDGPSKGPDGGSNLVVQVINGRATQHHIQMPIYPYFGKFGESHVFADDLEFRSDDKGARRKALPKIETGSTYRLRVYESGGFTGHPTEAYREAGIMLQTTSFYFRTYLVVVSGGKIDGIVWNPSQFLDRDALLAGIARNESGVATLQSSGWKLILTDAKPWPEDAAGKPAEVFGTIRATEVKSVFRVEKCRARLTRLEDQVGKAVALRGTARSLNGHWWFNYCGTDLYVEGMDKLPNWTGHNHCRAVEITGVLERAELPRIDQIGVKSNPDLRTYFIVRQPKWSPVDELLTPELSLRD